ncbi:MAG: hypothetical protein IKA23_06045 [Akkermansia sp.]|nr:hypothetical protein [Akkermansia sp.]
MNTGLGFSRNQHDHGHAGKQQESGKFLFHNVTGENGLILQHTKRLKSPVLFTGQQKITFYAGIG